MDHSSLKLTSLLPALLQFHCCHSTPWVMGDGANAAPANDKCTMVHDLFTFLFDSADVWQVKKKEKKEFPKLAWQAQRGDRKGIMDLSGKYGALTMYMYTNHPFQLQFSLPYKWKKDNVPNVTVSTEKPRQRSSGTSFYNQKPTISRNSRTLSFPSIGEGNRSW